MPNYHLQNVGNNAGRVVNFRTYVNGYDADHYDIKDIAGELPRIITECTEHYRLHDEFDLNVDLRQTSDKYKVICAIKKPKQGDEQCQQELAFSDEQKKLYRKLYNKELGSLLPRLRYYSFATVNTLLLIPYFRALCERYRWYKFAPFIATCPP